jgi:hypothetical protein
MPPRFHLTVKKYPPTPKGTVRGFMVLGTIFGWVPLAEATSTVVNEGPFAITFHDLNDRARWDTNPANDLVSGQNWTFQQIDDVVASIRAWDSKIQNAPGRQIQLHVFWYEFGDNSILGGSYSPSYGDGTQGWAYPEHIWRDGANWNGSWGDWDAMIELDISAAGRAWNFGSGAPAPNQIDFRTVVAHEVGHALGFAASYNLSNHNWGNAWGTAAGAAIWAGYQGLRNWDTLLMDSAGNKPVNGGNGTPGEFNVSDSPVYFTGSHAVDLYGANVPIYAPMFYLPSSSLSHLDRIAFPDALMNPYVSLGQMVREPTELEWEMMKDLGWTVPEPTSLLLALAGGGILFWRLARRRSS